MKSSKAVDFPQSTRANLQAGSTQRAWCGGDGGLFFSRKAHLGHLRGFGPKLEICLDGFHLGQDVTAMHTDHGMNKACLGVGVGEFVGVLVVAEWPGDNIDGPRLEQGLASKCCWARAALCCGCTGSEIGGRGSQQGHTVTTVILTCTWDLDFGVRGPWFPRVSTNWAGCHFDRRPGEPGLLWNSWLGLEPVVACAGSGADVDGRRDEQGRTAVCITLDLLCRLGRQPQTMG